VRPIPYCREREKKGVEGREIVKKKKGEEEGGIVL